MVGGPRGGDDCLPPFAKNLSSWRWGYQLHGYLKGDSHSVTRSYMTARWLWAGTQLQQLGAFFTPSLCHLSVASSASHHPSSTPTKPAWHTVSLPLSQANTTQAQLQDQTTHHSTSAMPLLQSCQVCSGTNTLGLAKGESDREGDTEGDGLGLVEALGPARNSKACCR